MHHLIQLIGLTCIEVHAYGPVLCARAHGVGILLFLPYPPPPHPHAHVAVATSCLPSNSVATYVQNHVVGIRSRELCGVLFQWSLQLHRAPRTQHVAPSASIPHAPHLESSILYAHHMLMQYMTEKPHLTACSHSTSSQRDYMHACAQVVCADVQPHGHTCRCTCMHLNLHCFAAHREPLLLIGGSRSGRPLNCMIVGHADCQTPNGTFTDAIYPRAPFDTSEFTRNYTVGGSTGGPALYNVTVS